jgi:hypothetical protein
MLNPAIVLSASMVDSFCSCFLPVTIGNTASRPLSQLEKLLKVMFADSQCGPSLFECLSTSRLLLYMFARQDCQRLDKLNADCLASISSLSVTVHHHSLVRFRVTSGSIRLCTTFTVCMESRKKVLVIGFKLQYCLICHIRTTLLG